MEQRIMTVVLTNGEKRTSVDTNIMVLINKYFDMLYCEKHIIGCTIKTPPESLRFLPYHHLRPP